MSSSSHTGPCRHCCACLPFLGRHCRCEEAYPVPEGTVGGVMILLQNFWGAAFLLVPIDRLGTGWQIWAVTACMATSTLVMAGFKPSYGRSQVDVRFAAFCSISPYFVSPPLSFNPLL